MEKLLSLGLGYAAVAAVAWGVCDFFGALLSKKTNGLQSIFWSTFAGAFFILCYSLWQGERFVFPLPLVALCILSGVFIGTASTLFYKAFEIGEISLITPFSSSYSVLLVIFSLIFLGEQITILQSIAIVLAALGAIFVSTNMDALRNGKLLFSDPGIPYVLVSVVLWAIGFGIFDNVVNTTGTGYPIFVVFVTTVVILLFYSAIAKQSLAMPVNHVTLTWVLLVGFFAITGFVSYGKGLEGYLTSLITPVVACYPLITVGLSQVFLKEKMSLIQIVGVLAILGGVVLLSI